MSTHPLLTPRGLRRVAPAALRGVGLLRMQDGWRGTLRSGAVRASLRIETGGWLRVRQPLAGAHSARALLAASSRLPGGVRCAGPLGMRSVLADIWLEGEPHLARTIEAIVTGFTACLRWARAGTGDAGQVRSPHAAEHETTELENTEPEDPEPENPEPAREAALARDQVESSIAALDWDATAVVRLPQSGASPHGWELRPRMDGAAQPVRVELSGARLRLQRALGITAPPVVASTIEEALAELALRLNERFRLARLVRAEDGLRVEAELHAGQLAPAYLAQAARAVAAACLHARLPLALCNEQEAVGRHFAAAFCAPEPLPAPRQTLFPSEDPR